MRLGDCVDFTVNLTKMSDHELVALRVKMLEAARGDAGPLTRPREDRIEHELYGDKLYKKAKAQLATAEMKAHRKTHGFNE